MTSLCRASLKFQGIFTLWLSAVVSMTPSAAQTVPGDMPVMFDQRERIAKPDLTGLIRLRFLTTVDFPPFNFIDQSGRLAGLHVDLAREICRELDIEAKCQIQAISFADLQTALASGQGEAVIAGVAITPQLRARFAFSRTFLQLPARFAVNRASMKAGLTPRALAGPVGVVAGTAHEAMLRAFFPKLPVKTFQDRPAMLAALREATIDAVFSDSLQLSFWTAGQDSAACCALLPGAYVSEHFLGEGLSIMNRRDDPALTQALDHALLELSRSGRLNDIYLRYFPTGIY